jgi:hypothetical protein
MKALRALSRSNPVGEALSFGVAFLVGAGLNLLLKKFWVSAFGHEAPDNPSKPGVRWAEALSWGLATGAAAGAAKVIARRGTDIAQKRLA